LAQENGFGRAHLHTFAKAGNSLFFIGEISTVFTFYHDWKFFPFLGLEMAMVSQQLQALSAS
jgi:hypothetical protein